MGRKGVKQYDVIASHLQERIRAGEFPPGSRLPTEPKLAEEYGVGRGAIRNALKLLGKRDLIEAKQGRGTFVLDSKPTEVELYPADHSFIIRMPNPDEVRRLGLRREGEAVIEICHAVHPIEVDLRGTAYKVFHPGPCERCPA